MAVISEEKNQQNWQPHGGNDTGRAHNIKNRAARAKASGTDKRFNTAQMSPCICFSFYMCMCRGLLRRWACLPHHKARTSLSSGQCSHPREGLWLDLIGHMPTQKRRWMGNLSENVVHDILFPPMFEWFWHPQAGTTQDIFCEQTGVVSLRVLKPLTSSGTNAALRLTVAS